MNAFQQLLTDHIDIWTAAETAKKSGRGRASSNAGRVYGISKLRDLILELAVRGELVSQDANDEPASELLKRLQAEKFKLISEGKFSRDKPWTAINKEEEPFDRPIGWEWARWNQVALKIGDIDHKMPEAVANGIPYVSPRDFNGNHIDFENAKTISRDDFLKLSTKIRPEFGDIIFPRYGTIGENVLVTTDREFLASYSCAVIKTMNNFIDPKYQFVYSISGSTKKQAKKAENKTTQANVGLKSIQEFLIPIPPLAEQHRIVAKVDDLMALCNQLEAQHSAAADAHEHLVSHLLGTLAQSHSAADFNTNWQRIAAHFAMLFTTEASIDALKQTLLQLAVMGKLAPQNPSDEPASELLKRIETEKSKLVRDGKIKKDKPLAAITGNEKPFKLPQGWEWTRLGGALEITGGVTLGRKLIGTDLIELPYLRVANVQRGYLDLVSIKTVEIRPSELTRYQLITDDLLVTEGGDWDKVGRTAVWNSEVENCVHQNHIFRMRIHLKLLSSSWIEMYMNSIAKAYFQSASKQTTNLASINMTQLRNCLLAVPALAEQHRIVAKVDELMALCDRMKARIVDAGELQRKLADVMVAQSVA